MILYRIFQKKQKEKENKQITLYIPIKNNTSWLLLLHLFLITLPSLGYFSGCQQLWGKIEMIAEVIKYWCLCFFMLPIDLSVISFI